MKTVRGGTAGNTEGNRFPQQLSGFTARVCETRKKKMLKYFSVICCAMSEKYCYFPPSSATPTPPKIPRLRSPFVLIRTLLRWVSAQVFLLLGLCSRWTMHVFAC